MEKDHWQTTAHEEYHWEITADKEDHWEIKADEEDHWEITSGEEGHWDHSLFIQPIKLFSILDRYQWLGIIIDWVWS